jgi:hypothetical protein
VDEVADLKQGGIHHAVYEIFGVGRGFDAALGLLAGAGTGGRRLGIRAGLRWRSANVRLRLLRIRTLRVRALRLLRAWLVLGRIVYRRRAVVWRVGPRRLGIR